MPTVFERDQEGNEYEYYLTEGQCPKCGAPCTLEIGQNEISPDRIDCPFCGHREERLKKEEMVYLQGRAVAVDPEEALDKIKASFPGVEFSRLKLRPCPVQPFYGLTWWEWLGKARKNTSLNRKKGER